MTKKQWDDNKITLDWTRRGSYICLIGYLTLSVILRYFGYNFPISTPMELATAIYIVAVIATWIGDYLWGWQIDEADD